MTKKDIAIVFDCGATNVRVIAMDTQGNIIAAKASSNNTHADPNYEGGLIWDIEEIWQKLCYASLEVVSQIDVSRIAGVTVTSFGVDGTLVDEKGEMLYPVISWQCKRTEEIVNAVDKYMPIEKIYSETGVFPYAFNTLFKLIWFKENKPDLLEKAHRFLFFPSLLLNRLSGEMRNDLTMAGTSMTMDIGNAGFSENILNRIGIDSSLFGELAKAGDSCGKISMEAKNQCGIPEDTAVFFAGHDTQFAIFGSGAEINQAVLSSGTWEVLMARSSHFNTSEKELEKKLTTEIDTQDGIYNIGQNWLGSGVLEWFSRNFYPELCGSELYDIMISEAETMKPGSHGLSIDPSFYKDSENATGGLIGGLSLNTSRQQIYRALLESLAFRLRESLETLQEAGNFKAGKIICVGGGSQNRLWNQLRADVCNLPIELIEQKETTVLGAALFVFAGAGLFASENEARNNISYKPQFIKPSADALVYDKLYMEYLEFRNGSDG
ncbi:MAG: L-fuculokinase [Bacteroidales bacterium]|nr:L-fuculokinase [Bacteroidales bacterium]MCF8391552.1 L-fuculokinase [Bacteroidales bacterium]